MSITHVLCNKMKEHTADILIPRERAITLVFWHQQRLVGDVPFHLKFALKLTHPFRNMLTFTYFFYIVSTIRASEKRKSSTGFPTNYRWSAYVTQRVAQKIQMAFFKNQIQLRANKVCYKVFLFVNFQQQSSSEIVLLCNGP